MPHMTTQEMERCVQNCLDCYRLCMETVAHCLRMGGEHASPEHIGQLLDCAALCRTAAELMLRGSSLHPATCGVCAEACRACAESCERIAGDDELMRRCAEACRRCADSCGRMAGVAA